MLVIKADLKATLRELSRDDSSAAPEPATAADDEIWAALERHLA